MMSEPVRGIVVAHGDLARALVDGAERISGVRGALIPVSNQGLGADELRTLLASHLEGGPAVLFVDLGGGSCGLAGLGAARRAAHVGVLTGVNLPVLLDFVFHRDMPLDALVARLEAKGRSELRGHGCAAPPPAT